MASGKCRPISTRGPVFVLLVAVLASSLGRGAATASETSLELVLAEVRELRAEVRQLREESTEAFAELRSLRHQGRCSAAQDEEEDGNTLTDRAEVSSADADHRGVVGAEDGSDQFGELIRVDVKNTDWMREVLFGGQPWVLHCLDGRSGDSRPPQVIQSAAQELKSMATFGMVDCWELMPSGKTLAHRFDFPKPPVTFMVANGDPPSILEVDGMSKAWQLKRKAAPYLSTTVERIDSSERFKQYCSSRKACLVVGFRSAPLLSGALKILTPLLEHHRGIRAVAVDTTVWKVNLDKSLSATKTKRSAGAPDRAELLCLTRQQPSGRSGAFFPASQDLTEETASKFLDKCGIGRGLVSFSQSPTVKVRPPETPKYKSPSSSSKDGKGKAKGQSKANGSGSKTNSRGRPNKDQKNKGRRADFVGSRDQLDEDEPIISSVDTNDGEVDAMGDEEDDEINEPLEEVEL